MPRYDPSPILDAGALRERIAVYAMTDTYTKGERSELWAVRTGMTAIPAQVEYERASEEIRAGRPEEHAVIRVTIRNAFSAIAATDRIVWNSETWALLQAPKTVDARRRYVRFRAVHTTVTDDAA